MAVVDGRAEKRSGGGIADGNDILRRLTQGPTPRVHERSSSAPTVPANDHPVCSQCGTEEWDNVTAERGRERDVPFNRCNHCGNEWESA